MKSPEIKKLERIWDKMHPYEKRAEIAFLCGWERGPKENSWIAIKDSAWHKKTDKDGWQDLPPDYLNDLNAMNEAEDCIPYEKKMCYAYIIQTLNESEQDAVEDFFQGIRYSAEQRAKAFFLTMKKDQNNE